MLMQMPSRTSPSPSPSPAAPAESSDEPGLRAATLRNIYTKALQSTLKSNSYANFASCFPTPATYCPSALQGVHKQLNARLEEECLKDFDKIMEERKTVQGLNEWDAILDAARQRRDRGVDGEFPDDIAPHLLTADQLTSAFLYRHLATATAELTGKLHETQQNNQEMMQRVQAQREEIERRVSGIEGLVTDLVHALSVLQDEHPQILRTEILNMEEELQSTSGNATKVSKATSVP